MGRVHNKVKRVNRIVMMFLCLFIYLFVCLLVFVCFFFFVIIGVLVSSCCFGKISLNFEKKISSKNDEHKK